MPQGFTITLLQWITVLCLGWSPLSQPPVEIAKLSPDAFAQGQFGSATSIANNTWVIGDPRDNTFGHDSGAVYVFSGSPRKPTENVVKIYPVDASADLGFGDRVSAYGNRIAATTFIGRTYIFRREHSQWVQEATIQHGVGASPVSLSEGFVAIGSQSLGIGSVAVYHLEPGSSTDTANGIWLEDALIQGVHPGDLFGFGLVLDGNHLLVGAPWGLVKGIQTGVVYSFRRVNDVWMGTGRLGPVTATAGAEFGRFLDAKGDRVLVGAFRNQPNMAGAGKGAAYVYQRDPVNDAFRLVAQLFARDGNNDDLFGCSVAIGEKALFVGAYNAESSGLSAAGAVYQFGLRRNVNGVTAWHLINKISASDAEKGDTFGRSMSYGNGTLLVGALNEGLGGAAYVYSCK